MEEKNLGADAAAVAFAGSSVMGLAASVLDGFDRQFGTDGPDKDSDSVGRGAGCDDCSSNVRLRAEHRVFVEKALRAYMRLDWGFRSAEREALEAIQSQCAGHADEFSGNVYRIATEALKEATGGNQAGTQ
jgi:hypothetical protein